MAGQLEGKVALVTGGSSGIGRATALLFAREGAKVVVADVRSEGGEETVQLISAAGGDACFVQTDVAHAAEVEALVRQAVATYRRLDCAVDNAGVEGAIVPTADYNEQEWDRVLAVNLAGVWPCMKYEIQQMLKQSSSAIVNTASAASLVGFAYFPAYTASKHGVVGLTKAAALEYAKAGIRVNAICCGGMRTPMTKCIFQQFPQVIKETRGLVPVDWPAAPEESAAAMVWLCSDAMSFVTGTLMPVDGGFVAQ